MVKSKVFELSRSTASASSFAFAPDGINSQPENPRRGGAMSRPVETQMTISCFQCEWSVEAVNTSVQESSAFLEAAYAHADQHEQHALEVVQRLRVYSENYVESASPPSQEAQPDTTPDTGIQTGFMDTSSRDH